jgi:hypothetical protein
MMLIECIIIIYNRHNYVTEIIVYEGSKTEKHVR